MKILLACEESQIVCIEFRKLGHEAYSCDLLPCSGGHPEWHIQEDCLKVIERERWDMMIAFPPCTYLSKAGARWWKQEGREEKSVQAYMFVMALWQAHIPKIAIENPRGKLNNYWRLPDQIIQPYWFGDPFSKATCLWLKNLPPLMATNMCSSFRTFMPSNTGGAKRGQKHTSGIPKNQKEASKTFPGIAKAMANTWGKGLSKQYTKYKMILNKQNLLTALEIVKPGLAKQEQIEQTTSFAFIKGRIVTYNNEISISHPVEGVDFEGAVKAEALYKFLSKIKKDEVEVEVQKNELVIISGRSKAGLTLMAEVKLPLEEVEGKKTWKPLPENFNKACGFALNACSKETTKPVLTCVNVKKNIVEASDGFRIVQYTLEGEMPVKTFLMPSTSISVVVGLKPVQISEGKGWVHFKTEIGTIVSCRVFEEVFPDIEKHTKVEGMEVEFPKTIEETLEKANVFAKKDTVFDEWVTVTFEKNRLKIRGEGDSGWFEEELNFKYEGKKVEFFVTPYLLKAILKETLKCIVGDKKLKFIGENLVYVVVLRIRS